MSDIIIDKADGGYILRLKNTNRWKLFPDFNSLVQYIAHQFSEVGVDEDWKP